MPIELRRYRSADEASFAALVGDAEVMRYAGGAMSAKDAQALFLRFTVGDFAERDEVWAVSLPDGTYVGHCALVFRNSAIEPELLFYIARSHWRQGFASEAARQMLEYARAKGCLGVVATIDVDNVASIRTCERIGLAFHERAEDAEGSFLVYRHDLAEQISL